MVMKLLRRLFHIEEVSALDEQYDKQLAAYFTLWSQSRDEDQHLLKAKEQFGLDEHDVEFLNQLLCSASLGTLDNWTNQQSNPWFRATRRFVKKNPEQLQMLRNSLIGSNR